MCPFGISIGHASRLSQSIHIEGARWSHLVKIVEIPSSDRRGHRFYPSGGTKMGHIAQPGQTKNKKPRFSNTCTNQNECLWVFMKRSRVLWGPPKDRAFLCPLQKPVLEKPSTPLGAFRFIMPAGPEELTLQALIPEQGFYTWTGMIKQVCEFAGAGQLQRAGQGWVR